MFGLFFLQFCWIEPNLGSLFHYFRIFKIIGCSFINNRSLLTVSVGNGSPNVLLIKFLTHGAKKEVTNVQGDQLKTVTHFFSASYCPMHWTIVYGIQLGLHYLYPAISQFAVVISPHHGVTFVSSAMLSPLADFFQSLLHLPSCFQK